jgi:hypothetical protein
LARLRPVRPDSHGRRLVDDRRGPSGMIFINRNVFPRQDTPAGPGPTTTLYNARKRWPGTGASARIRLDLADGSDATDMLQYAIRGAA